MEGSTSESVFDSLDVNPRLFINENLNRVDTVVDEAFRFYLEEASTLLKIEDADKLKKLSEGVNHIKNMIHSVLDKRLQIWEMYCLRTCFAVPEGFSLLKNAKLGDGSPNREDAFCQQDLDSQLDGLVEKLNMACQKSSKLNRKLGKLESQSTSSGVDGEIAQEASQLFDLASKYDMLFKEMGRTSSEARMKIDKLETKTAECSRRNEIEMTQNYRDGFPLQPLDWLKKNCPSDVQACLAELEKI